jgi:septum formation protein
MEIKNIILASSSPRRKQLLKKIGLSFDVQKSSVIEHFNLPFKPNLFAEYWAAEKAKDISNQNENSLIIGADTIVVLDELILGKPTNKQEGINMLSKLSGNMHEVITGVSIQHLRSGIIDTFHSKTEIFFNRISKKAIEEYVDTEKPYDKSGSYGIQDSIAKYIYKLNGCYYNVVGIPLSKFYEHYSLISENILKANPSK